MTFAFSHWDIYKVYQIYLWCSQTLKKNSFIIKECTVLCNFLFISKMWSSSWNCANFRKWCLNEWYQFRTGVLLNNKVMSWKWQGDPLSQLNDQVNFLFCISNFISPTFNMSCDLDLVTNCLFFLPEYLVWHVSFSFMKGTFFRFAVKQEKITWNYVS